MKSLALSLLTVSLFACGSPSTPPVKKDPPPTNPTTPTTAPTTSQSPSTWSEEYKNIPASAAMVFRFAPTEQMVTSVKKFSASMLSPQELATMDMGPTFLRIFGVDPTKSVLMVIDGAMPIKSTPDSDMPAFRVNIALTNTSTFIDSVQEYITKKQPSYRVAEETADGYAILYIYDGEPTREVQGSLRMVIFAKDAAASLFVFESGVSLPRSELQAQLLQYISTPVRASLADDSLFRSLLLKADPMGSVYFFINANNILKSIPDTSFKNKELSTLLLGNISGMAFSLTFSEKGLSGGYAAKINPPPPDQYRGVLPSKDAPPYGSIFPSGTSVLYRSSLDLIGLRETLFAMAPSDEVREALKREIADATLPFYTETGLSLESDLLSPMTGHFALGLDVSMLNADTPNGPLPPAAFAVFQLDDALDASKRLLAIAGAAESRLPERPFAREVLNGETVVTSTSKAGTVIAAQTCQDLLLFALGKEAVQEMCARAKTPGRSFIEGSSSALAREMVDAKSGGGFFVDLSSFMKAMMSAFPLGLDREDERETLSKLLSLFGPYVSRSDYDAASQLYFSVLEMSLRP